MINVNVLPLDERVSVPKTLPVVQIADGSLRLAGQHTNQTAQYFTDIRFTVQESDLRFSLAP